MNKSLLPHYQYQNITYAKVSGFIFDCWATGPPSKDGNNNKFPGSYPAGFLKRVKLAFKEYYPKNRKEILHVCSGRIPRCEGIRLDIDPKYKPDFVCDAQTMKPVKSNKYKWVMSDTPYNRLAAQFYYKTKMLNKGLVLKQMTRVCKVGGFVAVFDESFPVSPPKNLKSVARIAITAMPNLTFRCLTIFKKTRRK